MFASILNKGIGASLSVLLIIFAICYTGQIFTVKPFEFNLFPDLYSNYILGQIKNKWLITSINFFVIALGVLILNLICADQEITEKQNFFPQFFFLLICSTVINPFNISSQLISTVFVLIAFYQLIKTYRSENAMRNLFNAGFWISFSTFISITSLFLFPFFFVMIFIMRPFNWREWIISIFGLIAPIFIYECLAYLGDFNQWYFFETSFLFFSGLKFPVISEYYVPLILIVFFLLLVSIFQSFTRGMGDTVKKQRAKTILLWFILLSSINFFSSSSSGALVLINYAFPVSIFLGDYFFGIKQTKTANTFLTLIILCCVLVFLGKINFL